MISDEWVRTDDRVTRFPRLRPRRLVSFQTLALLLVVALVGWVGWLWYRGSSFVKVEHVTVTGLSGPDVSQIRAALTQTGLTMSTLHVNIAKLDASVQQYPEVTSLTVRTDGHHALLIRANEQVPVAFIKRGGTEILADGSGQLLSKSNVSHGELPTLSLNSGTGDSEVTGRGALNALRVLQAAPVALLSHVQSATFSSAHGVIVQLRSGPQVYFGPTSQLTAKWNALVDVLQSSGSNGAAYIDVSDPQRPAAGVAVKTTTDANTTEQRAGAGTTP